MSLASEEYTRSPVPPDARGPARRVFFIIAGTLCGLPVFVLSTRIMQALGFWQGSLAIVCGTMVIAFLSGATAFTGAYTGLNMALLAERIFGHLGAKLVKILICLSLTGWFGATAGLFEETATPVLHLLLNLYVLPKLPALVFGASIIAISSLGVRGLSGLGRTVMPVVGLSLIFALFHDRQRLEDVFLQSPTHAMSFGQAVAAIIGSSIVGIIIQPDYARFVDRPIRASVATSSALGIVYPVIMIASAIPALVQHQPDLVSSLAVGGFGVASLAILLLSAWIDASACLYSGGLALANQLQARCLWPSVLAVGLVGLAIQLCGVGASYVHFLVFLGIALPPVAAIILIDGLAGIWRPASQRASFRLNAGAFVSWILGSSMGVIAMATPWSVTGLPSLDAIAATLIVELGRQGLQVHRLREQRG